MVVGISALNFSVNDQRRPEEKAVNDLMFVLQCGNAILLVFFASWKNMKITHFVDHQQVVIIGNFLAEYFFLTNHIAAFFLGVGVEVSIDGHNAVIIGGDAGDEVRIGRFQFTARHSSTNLRRRGNAHIGNKNVAVVQPLFFHFNNNGIITVAVFGEIGFQGRASGGEKSGIQCLDIGSGQNVAQSRIRQHSARLQHLSC